jgi:hypothetical protein
MRTELSDAGERVVTPVETRVYDCDPDLAMAVARAKADFVEMPGLTLTLAQAARLWACDVVLCSEVLTTLVAAGFLVRTRGAAFMRAA